MAITHRFDLNPIDTGKVSLPLDGSTAVTVDNLYYSDRSNKVVKAVTSSAGSSITSLWVATKTVASGATVADFIPVTGSMLFECDCTAATASNQLMIRHLMTDAATINNTSTDSTDLKAIFEALAVKGAASDKKLIGRFIHVGQVVS